MARQAVYYAEVRLGDGKIIARLENKVRSVSVWHTSRHTSTDYELHMLLNDGAIIKLDDGKVIVAENQGVIIPPNIAHGAESAKGEQEHLYIHFSVEGDQLRETLRSEVSRCCVITLKEDTMRLAHELLWELVGDGVYRQELLETMMPFVIVKAFRDAGIVVQYSCEDYRDEDRERRTVIEAFFRADLPYGSSEEQLAWELGLSRRQLARVLQENYGMNFRQMLLKTRMDHAAWMLKATDIPISSIAEKLKYTSLSAFYRSFRAIYGITPAQYRKRMAE